MAHTVTVVDAAGVARQVRPVDAKEIEAAAANPAPAEEPVKDEPKAVEPEGVVDDQSAEPKVATKTTRTAKKK